MARMFWIVALLAIAAFVGAQGIAAEQGKQAKDKASAQAVINEADAAGVVIGEQFEFTAKRADFANKLLAAEAVEGTCQITCPGNKVAGISCPVGKMCQCSCPGGGPDCSCR